MICHRESRLQTLKQRTADQIVWTITSCWAQEHFIELNRHYRWVYWSKNITNNHYLVDLSTKFLKRNRIASGLKMTQKKQYSNCIASRICLSKNKRFVRLQVSRTGARTATLWTWPSSRRLAQKSNLFSRTCKNLRNLLMSRCFQMMKKENMSSIIKWTRAWTVHS